MGLDRVVRFADEGPAWEAVRAVLAGRGLPVRVMMIDGQLAYPDEEPPAAWAELRLGLPGGMVTVRRGPGRVTCVTWGNADDVRRQAWNAVAWAFARSGGGHIDTEAGAVDAEEFARTAELPPSG
jgi:hypothetical protein